MQTMTRRIGRSMVWLLCVVLAMTGAAVAAQGVLTQLGTTEASARGYVLDSIGDGGYAGAAIVDAARRGYAKIAPAGRAAATTAFYGWAKTYVNSAAFKADYAKKRAEEKPTYEAPTTTPQQEAQAEVNQKTADMETMAKQVRASLPPAEVAKFDAQIKQQLAQFRSKEMVDGIASQIADKRKRDKATNDELTARWTKNYPPDSNARIGEILREFLANTTDVDFAAKTKTIVGEGGDSIGFVNDAYNKKPWQWRVAFDYGPEVLAAARAAASAWVKELPVR